MGREAGSAPRRYDELTWSEIDDAAANGAMVIVPVGATEDHGPHLPLDVDRRIVEAICGPAVAARDDALLFPTVDHGYLPHHMDFPGGITIDWRTFVDYVIDVCVSLAHHGFERILLVNGHGSNHHLLELASRQVLLQYPDVHCAMLSWWQIDEVRETASAIREAGPQGSAHAGEMETSIYMHLFPERVDMDAAPRDVAYPESRHFNSLDLAGQTRPEDSTPVTMLGWWSTVSETGVMGDATVATPETGELLLEAAIEGLGSVLEEFAEHPIRSIDDHHSRPVTDREYDPFRPR
ncbi:creatininase family protein [Natrialbaceae archaeon GCM10025810]|uniref:creatininase family protein n=1 Tax=Halovalidus salilacus TaxID=3075124 RepID=UPI003613D50F